MTTICTELKYTAGHTAQQRCLGKFDNLVSVLMYNVFHSHHWQYSESPRVDLISVTETGGQRPNTPSTVRRCKTTNTIYTNWMYAYLILRYPPYLAPSLTSHQVCRNLVCILDNGPTVPGRSHEYPRPLN
jgi:hypothetical protein